MALLLCWGLAAIPVDAPARTLRVGQGQAYGSIADAARAAADGDLVEIEAGNYYGDVAVWNQKKLKIVGVNGVAVLHASGRAAEGKAIWVLRDGDFVIENIHFLGAKVPDRNGAGIRFEKGRLVVRNCAFLHNQDGLLTGNDKNSELEIESSEFAHDGTLDGQAHNLYVGQIKRLRVVASYFHHGYGGHLLKSRAGVNEIYYNRLTDEPGGQASYELELPAGGVAYVIGNLIEQSSTTQNPYIVSYGTEGYAWPRNELYLVNNTLVDDRPSNGVFLRVRPGAHVVKAVNNLLVGTKALDAEAKGEFKANYPARWEDLALEPRQDYRLKPGAPQVGRAEEPGSANGVLLRPIYEYLDPRALKPVEMANPGAMQSLAH